jgi:transcriptional regulator with XRE-family HTH domain
MGIALLASFGAMLKPRPRRNIAANVRLRRQSLGMTQAQLAGAADVADATVSRIERGRLVPSVDLAGRLASALNVAVDELLGPPAKEPKRPTARACEVRLLSAVSGMDDGQVDDIAKAVKLIVAAARRS